MVLAWCKTLAWAIGGHLRTEARPEPARSWRGQPLAVVGEADASSDPYRTLSMVCAPDGQANRPTTGSPPMPAVPNAAGPDGLSQESHS
jgi:hypothetical protein